MASDHHQKTRKKTITKDRLEVAYKNADLLAANDPLETEKNTENPYTSVGKLVKILTSLNAHLQR